MIRSSDLTKPHYRPGEVAKLLRVSPETVARYDRAGRISFDRTPGGRRTISKEALLDYLTQRGLVHVEDSRIDVVYARVSTHRQKERGDLGRQVDVVVAFAARQNPKNLEVLKEVGSGLNDNRQVLRKLLQRVLRGEVDRIFINYKDRLTRFGFKYIDDICKAMGTKIVVVSTETQEKSIQEELAEDLCAIIHSFSGKLYGMRKKVGNQIEAKVNALYEDGENGKD